MSSETVETGVLQPGRNRQRITWAGLLVLALVATMVVRFPTVAAAATCADPSNMTGAIASSSAPGAPASNAVDGNPATSWSSAVHTSSASTEWLAYGMPGLASHQVNYIKLRPRWTTSAVAFPASFSLSYFNGSRWLPVPGGSYANFPTPQKDDWVILVLPQSFNANAVMVTATTLSTDGNPGRYDFQLEEAFAGCNPEFDPVTGHWVYVGNDGSQGVHVQNVGSGSFDPNKLTSWHFDDRAPLVAADPTTVPNPNTYAAQAVWDPVTNRWDIFHGGWDGSRDGHDRIYQTTTTDFSSFSGPQVVIDRGAMNHVNNPSVVRVDSTHWRIMDTILPLNSNQNRTGFATSGDGVSWTPNVASPNQFINMSRYPNWTHADVNGANALYYADGVYNLYWQDFDSGLVCPCVPGSIPRRLPPVSTSPDPGKICNCTLWSTSTDGVNFTFQGVAQPELCRVANDVKPFTFGTTAYYLMGFHCNAPSTYMSVATSLSSFPLSSVVFSRDSSFHITSIGWVSRNNRLYGALYGGTPRADLTGNAIYAAWLQDQVGFSSSDATVTYAHDLGHGADIVNLDLAGQAGSVTGTFTIRDTDGSTLLHTTAPVTLRPGDTWRYQ